MARQGMGLLKSSAPSPLAAFQAAGEGAGANMGQLEIAERFVRRNHRLARLKADSVHRLAVAQDKLMTLQEQAELEPYSAARIRRAVSEWSQRAEEEERLLISIEEETERNNLVLCDTFSRLSALASSVFSLPLKQLQNAKEAADDDLNAVSPQLNVFRDGMFGPLPRVYGYHVVPKTKPLTPMRQTLGVHNAAAMFDDEQDDDALLSSLFVGLRYNMEDSVRSRRTRTTRSGAGGANSPLALSTHRSSGSLTATTPTGPMTGQAPLGSPPGRRHVVNLQGYMKGTAVGTAAKPQLPPLTSP